jgi:hypothetical protein
MSDFLEQVFAAQAIEVSPRRAQCKPDKGFAGGRYAVMLTLMAGLTAVPTWIMLRAGADRLDQPAAASLQPLLIDLAVPDTAAPATPSPPVVAHREPQLPAQPPLPPAATKQPVLEKQSYIDTGTRPVQKKRPTKTKAPARQKIPPAVSTPATKPPAGSAPASQRPAAHATQAPASFTPTKRPQVVPTRVTRSPLIPALTPPPNPAPATADLTRTKPTTSRIADRPAVERPEKPSSATGATEAAPRGGENAARGTAGAVRGGENGTGRAENATGGEDERRRQASDLRARS